jgi:hypothetical protein
MLDIRECCRALREEDALLRASWRMGLVRADLPGLCQRRTGGGEFFSLPMRMTHSKKNCPPDRESGL